jgi:mRNA interferase MazF
VVISPDEMNKYLRTIVIAPMTSTSKKYPTRAEVFFQKKKGFIALDQVRTIGRKRIVKSHHKLSKKEIIKVKSILKETYVD